MHLGTVTNTGAGTDPRARAVRRHDCLKVPVSLSLAILVLLAAGAVGAEQKKVVIPFDLQSKFDDGRYGQMVADGIWKKLERMQDFLIPDSMQDVRDLCAENNIKIAPDTPLEKIGEVVRKDFDAQIAIWGSVERAPGAEAEIYDLQIRCVDFSGAEPQVIYEKTGVRTKSVSEIPHLYVKEMLEKLSGRTIAGPQTARMYATGADAEQRWKEGKNLIVGGDFESGIRGVPKGWESRAGQQREPLGNLVRWMPEPANPKNKVIHFKFPAAVGDSEGVMYYSDWFPIDQYATYRFQVRWRSNGPAVKVFIKCYDEMPSEYSAQGNESKVASSTSQISDTTRLREVYRSQQNMKGEKNAWHVHTEDFTPKHTKYEPKWGRVMLYAYLGAGDVEFDDVVIKQIVPQPAEYVSGEKRHSLGTKVTLKEMEENERRGQEARERLNEDRE